MNQILYFTIEADVNGKPYRLSLPLGAEWTDAFSAIEQMYARVKEIAEDMQKRAAETAAKASENPEVVVNGSQE